MAAATQTQVQVKLVLLGDAAVGKSSLVLRFVKNQFSDTHQATMGAAFLTQRCRLPEDPTRSIRFEIWDTAGQERFHSLAPMYYRNAHAAVIVYDIMKKDTFDRAKAWILELRRHADPNIVIALAGNKSDLLKAGKDGEVSRSVATAFATKEGLLFYETSAKTGGNVVELFTDIARHVPVSNAKLTTSTTTTPTSASNSITLNDKPLMANGCSC